MDKKEQLTEDSSNVAHTNWTEHKESTSPFGIKLILLMYRIGGKFLVYPILYIIVFFVYLKIVMTIKLRSILVTSICLDFVNLFCKSYSLGIMK